MRLKITSAFPQSGAVRIRVHTTKKEVFPVRLRIPSWSAATRVAVNGQAYKAIPGGYLEIKRSWRDGDEIIVWLDMRSRILEAPHGSNRNEDPFRALQVGPLVLERDENQDPHYNEPVSIVSHKAL
ncbi:beta-L-arabinofuranosidase domain-containing protein [Niabella drilacis]|uniref:beta-L-arabinofuranosidase domain-containing protein n=1 Tax=Niabella drilacis (strain DSM 25811 / CCM 8410 / CCUG 62505 / LMG 26954 / E90) TaxID=1285928 RepID=UPI000B831A78|nr:beta-L-arabinofuranosidase domain-containing protein [Niabella drilacis]